MDLNTGDGYDEFTGNVQLNFVISSLFLSIGAVFFIDKLQFATDLEIGYGQIFVGIGLCIVNSTTVTLIEVSLSLNTKESVHYSQKPQQEGLLLVMHGFVLCISE